MADKRPESRIDTERFKIIQGHIREAVRRDPAAAQIVTRAKLRLIRDQLKEARVGRHVISSDEVAEGGGSGRHPSPLQYFVASVGF